VIFMDKDRQKPRNVTAAEMQAAGANKGPMVTEWQHFGEPAGEHVVFRAQTDNSKHLDLGHSEHSPEFS
jgi:hypothetical protein